MRFHREEFVIDGVPGQLTQTGLLKLMSEIDPAYLGYKHTTVVRWESGGTRPTRERLEVFGRALSLSRAEVDGLIDLAGLELRYEFYVESDSEQGLDDDRVDTVPVVQERNSHHGDEQGAENRAHVHQMLRFGLYRFALPGAAVAGSGFLLQSIGWTADLLLSAYVAVVIALMLCDYFLRRRRSNSLRDLLVISVFVLLGVTILPAPLTRMDSFGFYTVPAFAGTAMPFVLSLLVFLVMALSAGLIFDFLYKWQYSRPGGNPYKKAAWVSFPPLVFVYVCISLFTGAGFWVYLLEAFPVLGGVLMAMLVLRDDSIKIDVWMKRFLLQSSVLILISLTSLSLAATLIIYNDPSMLFLPDHTLLRSWDVDFAALGYPAGEYAERARMGMTWSALSAIVYMVVVIGGTLLLTIVRKDTGDSQDAAASAVPAETDKSRQRPKDPRVDVRYRPGWLAGHRMLQPMRSSAGMIRVDKGYAT